MAILESGLMVCVVDCTLGTILGAFARGDFDIALARIKLLRCASWSSCVVFNIVAPCVVDCTLGTKVLVGVVGIALTTPILSHM